MCIRDRCHILDALGDFSRRRDPVAVLKKDCSESKLLDTDDLRAVTTSGHAVCAQQLLRPKGIKVSFTRTLWRSWAPALAWQVTNRNYSDDLTIDPRNRLCTNTAIPNSCTIFAQRGSSVDEFSELCERIVQFLERVVLPAVRFKDLAADFIKDDDGKIWLIQIKAFALHEQDNGVPKQMSEGDLPSRKGYKKQLKCWSCLVPYGVDRLQCKLTAKMVTSLQHRLRQRGQACTGFDRCAGTADRAAILYQPHAVCQQCFQLYQAEQELVQVEEEFARSIGVPVDKEQVALSGSDTSHAPGPRAHPLPPPPQMHLYRLYIFLDQLRDLPETRNLELPPGTPLHMDFTVLGLRTRIALDPSNLAVRKLRTFHCFLENESELKPLLLAMDPIQVHLVATKPSHKVLGTSSLSTRLLPASKLDYVQSFSSALLPTTTLRATVGLVGHGLFDTTHLNLRFLHGVWQPEPDFYTCHPLPEEWIEMLTRLNKLGSCLLYTSPSPRDS
eukprot:TRINITY_DN6122_c0_g1_i2.p1 TRINITY_DN6122_c0_g1~~TRINITY_DN6122_c0_g1_i2.p1  ORF type:complete len:500 (+),score=108.33 TRINITY_DN6122_c0_g1_i2:158-1657(+)